MTRRVKIAVVDDEPLIRTNLAALLQAEGYETVEAGDGQAAEKFFEDPSVALILLDLRMPGPSGLDLLRTYRDELEERPVIMITAFGGSAAAIEAMKLGAFDYITKPFELDDVLFTVRRALQMRSLVNQVRNQPAAKEPDGPASADELVGRTPGMLNVFKRIGLVAPTSEPVLILGESGTGKELVASAIHRNSPRSEGPFVKVNCAAFHAALLESELFGHEKGAFTGAVARHIGRFEQAHGGTLFLDEIGELDIDLQAKLLRVVQTRTFERVGGNDTVAADVRILSATNRDLTARIGERLFREDLLYRLKVVTIELPALRDRAADIPLLANHLLGQLARKYGWPGLALSNDAAELLEAASWPGNVRQLQNVLSGAAIMVRGRVISPDELRIAGLPEPPSTMPDNSSPTANGLPLKEILAQTERRLIQQALEQTRWNRTQAAKLLGVSRRHLFDKILEYGLEP